ncbi:MAG: hypothetical protein JSW58_02635 [Candidatus Latescibacterota bacterium]|nr:MAG: hypothetical protein JSW58_02635 [Candidatus Latescibacterota bacterium]
MAKVVLICARDPSTLHGVKSKIEFLNRSLSPDNIRPNNADVVTINGVTLAILNPNGSCPTRHTSVCLGVMIDPQDDWHVPLTGVPDGTYALFRSNTDTVELVNDPVGSRTIWFIHRDDVFLASTSQRAIVTLLGSFEPNPHVYPWMLSAGQLGPYNSWDKRIRILKPQSRLFLDRGTWNLTIDEENTDFVPEEKPREHHRIELQRVIEHAFSRLELDRSRWVLPLSGGVDSRSILFLLKDGEALRCITWGLRAALSDPQNDAYIAKRLADQLGLDHTFFEVDISTEPPDDLFNRYLVAGEGRVDAVGGYMDGFEIWKRLFENGVAGIIRGDECFGMRQPVFTPFGVRRYVNCLLLSDYTNLPDHVVSDLPKQSLPKSLEMYDGEPILRWRDRLYHHYRMPLFMSALNDLKCSYVEVINPFLSRSIVRQVRTIPDSLRLGRKPFMDMMNGVGPKIGYAERSAIDLPENIFGTKPVVELITDELCSSHAASVLPKSVIDYLAETVRIQRTGEEKHAESFLKRHLPRPLTRAAGRITKRQRELLRDRYNRPKLDPNVMAFRAFTISRMIRMLSDDAGVFAG